MQTLANLTSRITATATTDAFADSRIANVSGLNRHYRDIGAYDDITPGDGSDATFMPAMPPPVPTCAGAAAVGTNPGQGLVDDCNALLDMKDTLAGTATLNWSKDMAMSSWDGIRLGGTPQRVHYLLLTGKELDGSIPALLGNLTELLRIDLDENSLTGEIPPQLGMLKKLTHLYLQDNELSGKLPPELGQMTALQVLYPEDNDLTGEVPEEIGDLSNLTQLVLADNQLSGPLPDSLGDLSNLGHLRLRDNDFTGQIPRALSALNPVPGAVRERFHRVPADRPGNRRQRRPLETGTGGAAELRPDLRRNPVLIQPGSHITSGDRRRDCGRRPLRDRGRRQLQHRRRERGRAVHSGLRHRSHHPGQGSYGGGRGQLHPHRGGRGQLRTDGHGHGDRDTNRVRRYQGAA